MAFGLVVIALLAFIGYLFPGVSSIFSLKTNLGIVVILAFVAVVLAFMWIKQMMVNPLIHISDEANRIADGDFTRKIILSRDDEIGELGKALNRMTSRIKDNMEELKVFSEKTESINIEINKRILSLTSLLQISNMISQNADLDKIIELGLDKCLAAADMTFGCLILKDKHSNEFVTKTVHDPNKEILSQADLKNLKVKLGEGVLGKAILRQESLLVDKNSRETLEVKELRRLFSYLNIIVLPITSRSKIHGLLIAANDKADYNFSHADKELLDLFSKQIAIAIENILLAKQVEKLEIIDHLTGLFNSTFVDIRLDEEIKRAISFQRPCAFVILVIDNFENYRNSCGHIAAENVIIKIGTILKENVSEVDKGARFGDHSFALILPERNKRQAIEVAEEIRKKIQFLFSEEEDESKKITITGAVTENPVDGITANELISKAKNIIETSRKQSGNRIFYKI